MKKKMKKSTKQDLIGAMIMMVLIATLACMTMELLDREASRQKNSVIYEVMR